MGLKNRCNVRWEVSRNAKAAGTMSFTLQHALFELEGVRDPLVRMVRLLRSFERRHGSDTEFARLIETKAFQAAFDEYISNHGNFEEVMYRLGRCIPSDKETEV